MTRAVALTQSVGTRIRRARWRVGYALLIVNNGVVTPVAYGGVTLPAGLVFAGLPPETTPETDWEIVP